MSKLKSKFIEVPCMFESSAKVQHSRYLRTQMPAAQHLGEIHFPPLCHAVPGTIDDTISGGHFLHIVNPNCFS